MTNRGEKPTSGFPSDGDPGPGGSNRASAEFDREMQWRKAAEAVLDELANGGRPFTSGEIVSRVGAPPHPSILPALVRAAHRRGLIVKNHLPQTGSVWVGARPAARPPRKGPGRRPDDRRRGIQLERGLWLLAEKRAASDKTSTEEILIRALRAYLKKR